MRVQAAWCSSSSMHHQTCRNLFRGDSHAHMMEYASLGSLKDYLRKNKPVNVETPLTACSTRRSSSADSGPCVLTSSTMTLFSSQVCSAMVFLEKHRIVHRDLAARNVLVLDVNRVKLSDFGLSRLLSNSECKTAICHVEYACTLHVIY